MMYRIIINLLLLSMVYGMDDVTLDLLTPINEYGEACGYMACPGINPDALNVHVVPATHGELGGTRTFAEHYAGVDDDITPRQINMKNILDAVITELWDNDKRKFTFSDMPYLFQWWKNRDSTVRRMVYQLLRQGRLFFTGGGWGLSDESTASYHAIIDQFTYSLRKLNATFLECGRPLVTWQVDNFGHSREFASLMAQMGFDGHFINPISYDDEMARMRDKKLEFVWRGSDDLGTDSDLFTHKLYDGYWTPPGFCFGHLCKDALILTPDSGFSNIVERVQEFMKLMKERQAPYYSTKHVMVIMGHRNAYYDADLWFSNLDRLISSVNERQADETNKTFLYYSTPACYLKAVQKTQPELTNKQDDFIPLAYDRHSYTSGMFTSRPSFKLMAREIHVLLQIAKQLQLFARLANNDKKFEDIQWITGVIHDHAILAGSMRQHVAEYYVTQVHKAKMLCMRMFRPAINILRNASRSNMYYMCPFNASSCWPISGDRSFIVVYNPLPWPVTLPIRLPVDRTQFDLYGPQGEKINHTIVSIPRIVTRIPERKERDHNPSMADELVFLAEDIPPMGFRSYFLQQSGIRAKRSILQTIIHNRNKVRQAGMDGNQNELADDPEYEMFDDSNDSNGNYSKTESPKKASTTTQRSEAKGTPPTSTTQAPTTQAPVTEATTTQAPTTEATTLPASLPITPFIPNYHDESEDNSSYVEELDYPQESTFRRMESNGYFSTISKDRFIKNEYIKINLNRDYSKITSMVLSNGVTIYLEVQMMLYVSDDPEKMGTTNRNPGSYIFRPMDPSPEMISANQSTVVVKSEAVEEIHMEFAPFAGIAVRLYKTLPYVEVDWVVGPIPVEDGLGREVFVRYTTDLQNDGVFYTDANGRQTMKRIKNTRGTYIPDTDDYVAGNFYPVTSKVYIEDTNKNIRFSVFPDRGEGCSSLDQGQIDVMLHRRILTVDNRVETFVNETQYGDGLVVRGKHRLYLSKADFRPNKVFEKKLAKELYLQPQVFTSTHPYYLNISLSKWRQNTNEYSALKNKLPIGIHVLTIEQWQSNLLIRLENYLESTDVVRNKLKKVFIDELFKDYKLYNCKETLLAANKWRKDYIKMMWHTKPYFKRFIDVYGNESNLELADDSSSPRYEEIRLTEGISMAPQQIRTFVCNYEDLTLI